MFWKGIAMNADRSSQAAARGHRPPESGDNGDASAHKEPVDSEQTEISELDAMKLLLKQFQELREYLSYYVTAKTDGVKLSLRNTSLWIVFASLGLVAVAGLILTANWFVLSGTAEGLGVFCGGRLWAGKIMAGFLVLVGLGMGVWYTSSRRRIASRERTVQKYEKRQAGQQAEFGRTVSDRAAAAAKEN